MVFPGRPAEGSMVETEVGMGMERSLGMGMRGKTNTSCYHHLVGVSDPGILYASRHSSRMRLVAIYCATMIFCLEIYSLIS